ncbi:MAG: asparagine synthase-related protein [bacterium]
MKAVLRNRASGLLLSGGLDSAILASISPNLKAITVRLADYGEDKRYAASVVRLLNIEAHQKSVDIDEAIEAIPEVIKVLATQVYEQSPFLLLQDIPGGNWRYSST